MHTPMRRIRVLVLAPLLPAILMSGCTSTVGSASPTTKGTGPSRVSLTTDASVYHPGARVGTTLRNDSERLVGYNLCFANLKLERRSDRGWDVVRADLWPDKNTACTTELRLLHRGGIDDGQIYLPKDLTPGTYRLIAALEIENAHEQVASDSFTVEYLG